MVRAPFEKIKFSGRSADARASGEGSVEESKEQQTEARQAGTPSRELRLRPPRQGKSRPSKQSASECRDPWRRKRVHRAVQQTCNKVVEAEQDGDRDKKRGKLPAISQEPSSDGEKQ